MTMTPPEMPNNITENLRTQDNRCTAHPVFMVEQKRRLYGFEDGDEYDWMHTDEWVPVDAEEIEALEEHLLIYGEEKKGFARRYYTDIWEFCTACFTEQGCKDYLALNGHNLTEPRIYVHSAYRNKEWIQIREFLLAGEQARAESLEALLKRAMTCLDFYMPHFDGSLLERDIKQALGGGGAG